MKFIEHQKPKTKTLWFVQEVSFFDKPINLLGPFENESDAEQVGARLFGHYNVSSIEVKK